MLILMQFLGFGAKNQGGCLTLKGKSQSRPTLSFRVVREREFENGIRTHDLQTGIWKVMDSTPVGGSEILFLSISI